MIFERQYELRKTGVLPMFMTNYSNSMEDMMLETGLNESTCLFLLHVYSFSYFKRGGVKNTSHIQNLDRKIQDTTKKGYLRMVVPGVQGVTEATYCISPTGMEVCLKFYNNLI